MKSRSGIAGYNLGTPSMASYRSSTGRQACFTRHFESGFLPLIGMTNSIFLVTVIASLLGSSAAASVWADPARELARKVAEITGPGAVAVEVGNRSSMSKADVAAVKSALEVELTAGGVHLAARDRAAAVVVVTLSENVREYVWVAEIVVGKNEKSVVMVAVPRAEA